MQPLKVICINDSNRPNEVPINRWIKKGKEYTIVQIDKLNQQNIYGCKLAEINNDDLYPYQYFALNRFAQIVNINDLQLQETDADLQLA